MIASDKLSSSITRSASVQSYWTIALLADRDRVADAYRAYAYFRWVDDWLDEQARPQPDRLEFVYRQQRLIEACFQGLGVSNPCPEEQILVDLVQRNPSQNSGLASYIYNMMAVMAFDAGRRGRIISQAELNTYEHSLAVAVTEALHYFIGHRQCPPHTNTRYLAVTAAHITHMLRDTCEDVQAGYFNIPAEFLQASGISPLDVNSEPYRQWVRNRLAQARQHFKASRDYLVLVQNPRCRLAAHAYAARFTQVLDQIEQDGFVLRHEYPRRRTLQGALQMGRLILVSALGARNSPGISRSITVGRLSGKT